MKVTSISFRRAAAAILLAVLSGSLALPQAIQATDPIPGTSKSGLSIGDGGGGGKSSTPAVTPTPAPAPQPILTAALNFTAAAEVNGVIPLCSGSYRIDPYYPTLSLMKVNVRTDSVNGPDGTVLYVTVNGAGETLYPFTANTILIAGQTGTCTQNIYITSGTVTTSVVTTDAAGTVISAGN